ncbi:MAG: VWA domain-containing protein, partial [Verrucomicrobiaceae bacterium]
MSFLNSALFPSLMLLATLPLVIHLLNLSFPKLFQFSSVQQLRKTLAQRSRLFKWRHRILLLLRTLFLLALLFAFLKPVLPRFGADPKAKAPRSVVLVMDHSMSMEHKGGGLTARQRAQAEAAKILDTLGPDDLVNVVLAGAAPSTCFMDLSRSHGEARRFIENLRPGLTQSNLSQANTVVARLLAKDKGRPEIYYLSDFQRKNWSHVDFSAIPANARVFFMDAASSARENRAILSAALNQAQILAGDTVTLEVEVGNFTPTPMQEPVKITVDERSSFEKEISV